MVSAILWICAALYAGNLTYIVLDAIDAYWQQRPGRATAVQNVYLQEDGAWRDAGRAVRIVRYLDNLTDTEGHSVTLGSANVDFNGLPDQAVIVCGDYTNWEQVIVRADTVEECLRLAHEGMEIHAKAPGVIFRGARE